MLICRCAAILFGVSLAILVSPGAAADPEEPALDAVVRADFGAAARAYLDLLKAAPSGPLADYFLLRVLETASRAGPSAGTAAKEAIDAATRSGSWAAKAQAAWVRADAALRRADTAGAEKIAKELGLVRDWAVIGPFENENEAGFADAYGPEEGLEARKDFADLAAVHEGKQGKCRWFVPGAAHPLGALDFSRLFRLGEDVCAYACTAVHSFTAEDAAFRIGSNGPVKVWLNGRLVHAGDAYRSARLDQDAVPARLEQGWNEILVKSCQKKGPWHLLFRITAPDGSPLPGLEVAAEPRKAEESAARAAAGGAAPKDVERGAAAHLARIAAGASPSALDLARCAILLRALCACDENDTRIRDLLARAVEAAPGSAAFRLLLADEELDRNRALVQALEARKLAPAAALPAYALSRFYGPPKPISWGWWSWFGAEEAAVTQEEYARIREVEMPAKEKALLEEALAARPDFLEAKLALASHFFRRAGGNPSKPEDVSLGRPFALEAKRLLEEVLAAAPREARARKMLDAFAVSTPEAEAKAAQARLAEDFTDAPARARRVRALLGLGRVEEAVGVLGDRLRLNPFDSAALAEMAAAYRAHDALDRAAGCLELALAVSPENVEFLVSLGDARLAAGDRAGAVEAFRRALSVRPQMAEIENRLRRLGPAEREFYEDFRADLAPYVQAALADRTDDKAPAVVWFKNEVVRVLPNGTSRNFHQKVVKVLSTKGVDDHQWISAFPGRRDYYAASRGEVKLARVWHADGTQEEGNFQSSGSSASFPNLREGDVIAFEVKVEETGEPRYKGYFGLMLLLQDSFLPVKESRATFLHPPERPLYFQAVRAPEPAAGKTADGLEARTWTLKDLPEVPEEFNMPGIYELCPYVHASTFRTWAEVDDWFANIVKDQLESSEEIRRAVREAVQGLRTPEEKVDAVFRLLVSEIRYESLDLADHAYRPFKARQTFDRKYGDCKDTATLLKVMLREAGVESCIVLIRAGESERIDFALPSMKIFNHAIAFVPGIGKDGLLLDATARYCGSRELPEMDQGAIAFIAGLGEGGKALVTAYDRPEANRTRARLAVRLGADGSAAVASEETVQGHEAYEWRSEFQKGVKREEEMEKRLNRAFKSARLEEVTFSDVSDYNRLVEVKARFAVPALARSQGGDLALRPVLEPYRMCEEWATTATRYHDLVIGPPRLHERTVEIELPAGWKAKSLPRGLQREDDAGAYRLEVRSEPGKIVVRRVYERRAARIARDRYAAFRAFCEEVDRAEDEELVLTRG